MVHFSSVLRSSLLAAAVVQAESCQNAPEHIVYPQKGPIPAGPALDSSPFIGSPANATFLQPLYKFYPEASLMHTDGGNSGARDDPGPLGINPNVSSVANNVNMMVWGADGSLTCGYANASSGGTPPLGIVAMDPSTLQILAAWYPPDNETLRLSYLEYLTKTDDVVVSTKEGNIYVVHRDNACGGAPHFSTVRRVALAGALAPGQQLLNAMFDAADNLWFTSGATPIGGDAPERSATVGYVTPAGEVVTQGLAGEMVENGIAVSGRSVYMVTSTGANSTDGIGAMYSLSAERRGRGSSVKVNWRVPYNGDAPGGASGSSPTLLADKYVAITDRAEPQIKLRVYHQAAQGTAAQQQVCEVPLFAPGRSSLNNALLGHFDGETYGIIAQNDFGAPPVYAPTPGAPFDANGGWNDMSAMAGGMVRVDVDAAAGNCSVRWDNPDLAVKGVSILSTKVGLIYSYVQDTQRAAKGEYVWYVAAVDWNTGETVYKAQTGTGGNFNDNYIQASIGPDGTFYQTVMGGIVAVRDGQ